MIDFDGRLCACGLLGSFLGRLLGGGSGSGGGEKRCQCYCGSCLCLMMMVNEVTKIDMTDIVTTHDEEKRGRDGNMSQYVGSGPFGTTFEKVKVQLI